jgi:hypothetical protein
LPPCGRKFKLKIICSTDYCTAGKFANISQHFKTCQLQKQLAAQDTVYTMSIFSNIMNYCGFFSLPRVNGCKSQNAPKNIHPQLSSAFGAMLLRLRLNHLKSNTLQIVQSLLKLHNLSSLLGSGTVPAKASLHLNCAFAKSSCCKSHNPT